MKLKHWKWWVANGQILARRVITVQGRSISLDVKSPTTFDSKPEVMIGYMTEQILGMTNFSVRRQLIQAGIPKRAVKGLRIE